MQVHSMCCHHPLPDVGLLISGMLLRMALYTSALTLVLPQFTDKNRQVAVHERWPFPVCCAGQHTLRPPDPGIERCPCGP